MKILFICYTYFGNIGGMENVTKKIVDVLRKEHEVQVLLPKNAGKGFDNGKAIQLESTHGSYTYMPELKAFLEKNDFDLYFTVGFAKHYFDYIGEWCKKNNKKCISVPIGYFHTKSQPLLKFIYGNFIAKRSLKNYDIVVTATNQEREFWINKYHLNENKFVVIPHSLEKNFSKYKKTGITKKIKEKYILYIGRNGPNKRIDLLIQAYKLLNPKQALIIAGFGTDSDSLNSLAKENNKNPEKIKILGKVSENEKKELIDKASLCVFPSDYETYGLVLLEAASFGTPVIGSNIPAFKELLKDKKLLFENNAESLSATMKKNLRNKKKPKLNLNNSELKYLEIIAELSHKLSKSIK